MAIGARRGDIMRQFPHRVRPGLPSRRRGGHRPELGGGNLLTLIAGTPLSYSMLSIVLAFASCSPIGVGFGFMPARAASRLDPLAALARH